MHIRCTNCGADVAVGDTTREVVCSWCQTLLFVGKHTGIPHVVMSDYVSLDDAQLRLGRFLSKKEVAIAPRVIQRSLVYLPYWHLNLKKPASSPTWVAASFSPIEELMTITAAGGDTMQKTTDDVPAHLMVEAELLLEDAVLTSQCDMDELHQDKPATLIHVPFVKIEYVAAGEAFRAYVDLVGGNVYTDNTPPSPQRQKSLVLGLVAAAALLLVIGVVTFTPATFQFVLLPLLLWGMYMAMMKLLSHLGW
ncbi:MAG: hypothetical protein JXR76_17720 [Deltaproteobacteria bacterium]|nr:hypothetical protein [Deltaproteobacteria bacterium]